MHADNRILPYSFRHGRSLRPADDRSAQPMHLCGPARSPVSARSSRSVPEQLLLELASSALELPEGSAMLAADTAARIPVDPPYRGGLAIVGLECPSATLAVAATSRCETQRPDGGRRRGVLAWSVDRQGYSLALFREHGTRHDEILSTVAGRLADCGLRALGQPTPRCYSPTVWFPDGVFLQRVARLLERRGAACSRRRLTWDRVSRLYPLNVVDQPLPAWAVRHLRQDFNDANTWSSLRLRVVEQSVDAPSILAGLTPPVAAWLDDGSFARWVLSRVSEAPRALEWLRERLDDHLADDLSVALGDVHQPAAATR